jgi:hypothetical protein
MLIKRKWENEEIVINFVIEFCSQAKPRCKIIHENRPNLLDIKVLKKVSKNIHDFLSFFIFIFWKNSENGKIYSVARGDQSVFKYFPFSFKILRK